MKRFVYIGAFALLTAGFAGCGQSDNASNNLENNNVATNTANTPDENATTQVAEIKFEETEYDFGRVVAGEPVKHVFKFTNTGSVPLLIQNASASCGCTVPRWPKEPIAPGATGEIAVEFDSQGRVGSQNKTITIIANTQPNANVVTLKGEVLDASNGPVAQ